MTISQWSRSQISQKANRVRFQTICRVGEVDEGDSRMFVVGETPVALFKLRGDFFALHNGCPHAGASLAHGTVEADVVRCRIHHWGFCVRDGRYVDEDKPAFDARTIPVRVVGDEVQVAIDDGDRTASSL